MNNLTKSEAKKRKQVKGILGGNLRRVLIDFENRYLGDYVGWKIKLEGWKLDVLKENLKKKDTVDNRYFVKKKEEELSRDNVLVCCFIGEAKKGYDIKLERLIEKIVEHGLNPYKLRVKRVDDVGIEFGFLVTDEVWECHARVIYACGEINAPHYRFITTVRKV